MARKDDLEKLIRDNYQLIREYEGILELAENPLEKRRAEKVIAERWELMRGYLAEYQPLCQRLGATMPQDILEMTISLGLPGNQTNYSGDKTMTNIEDFDRVKARITAVQGELHTIEEKFEDGDFDMDSYLRLRRGSITRRERQLAKLQRLLSESGVSEMDLVLEKIKTDSPDETTVKQELEQAASQAEQKGWGQHLREQVEAHKGDIVGLVVAIAVQVGKAAVGLF